MPAFDIAHEKQECKFLQRLQSCWVARGSLREIYAMNGGRPETPVRKLPFGYCPEWKWPSHAEQPGGWNEDGERSSSRLRGRTSRSFGDTGCRSSRQGQAGRIREDLLPLRRGLLLRPGQSDLSEGRRICPVRLRLERAWRTNRKLLRRRRRK